MAHVEEEVKRQEVLLELLKLLELLELLEPWSAAWKTHCYDCLPSLHSSSHTGNTQSTEAHPRTRGSTTQAEAFCFLLDQHPTSCSRRQNTCDIWAAPYWRSQLEVQTKLWRGLEPEQNYRSIIHHKTEGKVVP